MTKNESSHRYLAIYPHVRGLSFVLLTNKGALKAFGRRTIGKDKQRQTQRALGQLIDRFRPGFLILEESEDSCSARRPASKRLLKRLASSGAKKGIGLCPVTRSQMRSAFEGQSISNKDDRASFIASVYPQLQDRLPPRREVWMPESESMGVFDAMALGLTKLGLPEQPMESATARHIRLAR